MAVFYFPGHLIAYSSDAKMEKQEVKKMKKTFSVPNISCGHCVRSIKNELSGISGVTSVDGSPDEKTISVEWNPPLTEADIRKQLASINYPAE
jgi:copper chaperone CopZ